MMTKSLSYAKLESILFNLGFVAQATTGSQRVFHHAETDTLIVLPPGSGDDTIDAIHLIAVRRMLVERGLVADAVAFDALVSAGLQHA